MPSSATTKKFFEDKGVGFITHYDGSDDVFAHVKENPDLEGCSAVAAVKYDTKYDDYYGNYNAANVSVTGGGGSGGGGGGGGGYHDDYYEKYNATNVSISRGGGGGGGGGNGGGYQPYGKGAAREVVKVTTGRGARTRRRIIHA